MSEEQSFSRREFLTRVGVGGAMLAGTDLIAACGGSSGGSSSVSSTQAPTGKPAKGGTLRIAINGGSAADTMDAHIAENAAQSFYGLNLYDQLAHVDIDFKLTYRLADEITPNKDGSVWTVRLKQGLEFHNGKTVSADDVIFSFNRILNPKTHATGAGQVAMIQRMKRVDARTVQFDLKQPTGWFDLAISDGGVFGIVPVGYNPHKPVGTGAWKYASYSPGEQAQFSRFAHYFDGPPLLDGLTVPLINDDQARLNSLQSGEVDAVSQILSTQLPQIKGNSKLVIWNSPTGSFYPVTMRVDIAPFNDVRARQALRLAVNRPQVISSAFGGQGQVGNDVYGVYDPAYDHSLKREQDLAQAKALLKQIGHKVTAQLVCANVGAGAVEMCQVVAANANEAGMNITVREVDSGTLFGPNYLQWPLAIDTYPALHYLTTASLCDGPKASINETHWSDPAYEALFNKASEALSASARKAPLLQMQKIMFERGGFLIPAFPNNLAAYSNKLAGIPPRDVRGFTMGCGTLDKAGFVA